MKSLTKFLLLILSGTLLATTAQANVSIRIGKNCAKFYYQSPARWHNNKVNLNCVSVRRIKQAPRVDGTVFFVANTYDNKYRSPGGRIVVAVPLEEADSFARKYGTTTRYRNHRNRTVRHVPLRGVFRKIDEDVVYLDVSGKNIDLVVAHRDDVRKIIIHGMNTKKRHYPCRHCKS